MHFVTNVPPPTYVDSYDVVEEAVCRCSRSELLAADTETLRMLGKVEYGNMRDEALFTGLCPDEGTRYLVPRVLLPSFKEVLEDPHVPKAFHNFAFDAHRLANAGITVAGRMFDTLMADFLLDEDTRERRHGLKECVWDFFQIPMGDYKDLFAKVDPRAMRPGHDLWPKFLDYSSMDAWATRKLALHHMNDLRRIQMWPGEEEDSLLAGRTFLDHYWDTEEPQLYTLWRMERRGIRVDRDALSRISASLTQEMDEVATELNKMLGFPFNPASSKQCTELFVRQMGFKPLKTSKKTGAPSADESFLKHCMTTYGSKEAMLVLTFRQAQKLRGTYADGLAQWIHTDGKIHTSYSATKVTGRLGSNDPNLQNIPTKKKDKHGIRMAFLPDGPDDSLFVGDYAQLEIRILAERSRDENLIRNILNWVDLHSAMGCRLLSDRLGRQVGYDEFVAMLAAGDSMAKDCRSGAKPVNFGISYGITKFKLAEDLSEIFHRPVSTDEAQVYIDTYLEMYPGVADYMQDVVQEGLEYGYVQTICGRRRHLSKLRSGNWKERSHAANQASNAPIQGSAADIVKRAMIAVDNDAEIASLGGTLRLQVHDELVLNGPDENAEALSLLLKDCMENVFYDRPMTVPLPVDPAIVKRYGDAK